jgi:hypothetical protein
MNESKYFCIHDSAMLDSKIFVLDFMEMITDGRIIAEN